MLKYLEMHWNAEKHPVSFLPRIIALGYRVCIFVLQWLEV